MLICPAICVHAKLSRSQGRPSRTLVTGAEGHGKFLDPDPDAETAGDGTSQCIILSHLDEFLKIQYRAMREVKAQAEFTVPAGGRTNSKREGGATSNAEAKLCDNL